MKHAWLLLAAVWLVGGCATKPPPDPNDPEEVGMVQPEVLERSLRWAWEAAETRVVRGEITEQQAQEFTRARADELVEHIDLAKIPDAQAFAYGQVFRTAQRWEDAKTLFETALETAKTEDIRVNAGLRLAQSLANLGQVDEAIATARSVFDAPDHEAAPILPAVLYEIVPAGRRKGKDAELAKLLEDAVAQHQRTRVDVKSEAGQSFLMAMGVHIQKAWELAARLYRSAGEQEKATQAIAKALESRASEVRI